ncbi:hypothetical protein HUJ04_011881 [Dendroctonus ponderosae]|nr:hypothetical protein HUJ04_011881 [Dendroctonus ponderosae]
MERVAVKELCKYGWDHGRSLMMFRNVAELDFLGTRAKIDLFREQTSRIIDTVNKQEVSRKTGTRRNIGDRLVPSTRSDSRCVEISSLDHTRRTLRASLDPNANPHSFASATNPVPVCWQAQL